MKNLLKLTPTLLLSFCPAHGVPALEYNAPHGPDSYEGIDYPARTSQPDFSVAYGEVNGEEVVIIEYYNRLFPTPSSPEFVIIETKFGPVTFEIWHGNGDEKELVYAYDNNGFLVVDPPYAEVEDTTKQTFIVYMWKGM